MSGYDAGYHYARELERDRERRMEVYRNFNKEGLRVEIGRREGYLWVTADGMVLRIDLTPDSVEYMTEDALAGHVLEAIQRAQHDAGIIGHNILFDEK